jgi:hypothetical protein
VASCADRRVSAKVEVAMMELEYKRRSSRRAHLSLVVAYILAASVAVCFTSWMIFSEIRRIDRIEHMTERNGEALKMLLDVEARHESHKELQP